MKNTRAVLLLSASILLTTACASLTRRNEAQGPVIAQSPAPVAPAVEAPKAETPPAIPAPSPTIPDSMKASSGSPADDSSEMQVTLKKNGQTVAAPSAQTEIAHKDSPPPEPAPVTAAAPAVSKRNGVPAEKALSWLKNGNVRFVKGYLRKDGQSHKDVVRLANSQSAHAIILSCSDSRVPPEILFDQKLGEIFVVRSLGPNVDSAVLGSIEYAVQHLGVNLIVVMGHTSCGLMTAAVKTLNDGGTLGSPAINGLVAAMHPRIVNLTDKKPSPGLEAEAWANVSGVAQELTAKSEIIHQATQEGLQIKTAIYDTARGTVSFQ